MMMSSSQLESKIRKHESRLSKSRSINDNLVGSFLVILMIIVCGNQGSEISDSSGGGSVGKPLIESTGNVTVLAGQTGQLKCRVTNPANYTVSWLRHRDMSLLTSGVDAYTADPRFRSYQGPGHSWGLRISNTRATDSGVYECQISTTPPIPAFTYLSVVEPVTHIEGLNEKKTELFIKAGSTINLTCIVEDATENAPKHILWRHNSRMINFEWARGGMSLVTEKKTKGVTVSRLLIQKAVKTDSGIYQCEPQNAHPAHVKIHVLEQGEKQAAMQSRSSPSGFLVKSLTPLLLPFIHLVVNSDSATMVYLKNSFPSESISLPSPLVTTFKNSFSTLNLIIILVVFTLSYSYRIIKYFILLFSIELKNFFSSFSLITFTKSKNNFPFSHLSTISSEDREEAGRNNNSYLAFKGITNRTFDLYFQKVNNRNT